MSSAFERLQKLAEEKKKAEKPKLEVVPKTDLTPSSPSTTTTPTTPSKKPTSSSPSTPSHNKQPVAPERDFQKVSNSIVREAIPGGLFKSGKCKQLYDALYSLTRGAIQPQRTVRINKPRLMKMSGIGTRETLWQNLKHLELVGLVEINVLNGEHGGNEYTVYLPEELKTTGGSPSSPTTPGKPAYSYQNPPVVPVVESTSGSPSSKPINTGVPETPKTSFKDNTNDDEAFALFIKNFDKVSRELTGKGINPKEAERWGKLSELLILELHTAARHTQVSSLPAFLTEHLRRKLLNVPAPKPSKVKTDTVGKSDSGDYEIRPLDEKGRESALAQLREFAGEDFLQDFKKWYTEEDWLWLMKELKK